MLVESYNNVPAKDKAKKKKYINEVWDCIKCVNPNVEMYASPEDIMGDDVSWKLQKNGDAISSAVIYKLDPLNGRNIIFYGHDGSDQGMNAVYKSLLQSMISCKEKNWAEVDDSCEERLRQWGAFPIPVQVIEQLSGSVDSADGIHYNKNGSTKVTYGNIPNLKYLSEDYQPILEDKVVKFEGETYPDFGWCVIMGGAPGSGKSTVLNNLIPIDAKVYNPDDIKEFTVEHGDIVDDTLVIGNKKYPLDGIEPPYTLKNPEYVSFLHKNLKPLSKKLKAKMWDMGINAEEGRLPNIAFDITGSDMDDFENIIYNLAPLGYKFCVVWVFNTLEKSLENNARRSRTISRSLVIDKYFDTLNTIPALMKRSDLIQYVKDFWLVLPVEYSIKTRDGKYRYIKDDNVRKIDIKNNKAYLANELADMIFDQQEEVLRKYRDEI